MPRGQKNPRVPRCSYHPHRFGSCGLSVCDECAAKMLVLFMHSCSDEQLAEVLKAMRP